LKQQKKGTQSQMFTWEVSSQERVKAPQNNVQNKASTVPMASST